MVTLLGTDLGDSETDMHCLSDCLLSVLTDQTESDMQSGMNWWMNSHCVLSVKSTPHSVVNWKCVYKWPVSKGLTKSSSWKVSSSPEMDVNFSKMNKIPAKMFFPITQAAIFCTYRSKRSCHSLIGAPARRKSWRVILYIFGLGDFLTPGRDG